MANDIKLQEGHPVDENLRPLKVGGKSTAIETAQHGNGAKVNGDFEATGETKGITASQISFPDNFQFNGESPGHVDFIRDGATSISLQPAAESSSIFLNEAPGGDDFCQITTHTNGSTTLQTVDNGGEEADLTLNIDGLIDINSASGEDIKLDAGGNISLDAQGGNITLLDGGLTYTPSHVTDATTKAYVDTKYFFSQTMNFYNRVTDHDIEWIICNNESFYKLGGSHEDVDDTETAIINSGNQSILRSLWFIVPYNMTITHISGNIMDDDIDSHAAGNYRLGIWTVASLGTSGSTPAAQTGSQTFTLKYVTETVSGAESNAYTYAFYDASPTLTLSAGDGVWVGNLNTRSTASDDTAINMSIWGYAT